MGLSRSTFYDTPLVSLEDEGLLARIGAICDEFECYGYRRVGAALRHQGVVVNGKKLRRLMREHGLQPKRRQRYVVTTDSDHDPGGLFPSKDPVKSARAMAAMDALNGRFGRGTVRPLATGFQREWATKARRLSPRYTTRIDEAMFARAW
jgi:transposase InsO family protein